MLTSLIRTIGGPTVLAGCDVWMVSLPPYHFVPVPVPLPVGREEPAERLSPLTLSPQQSVNPDRSALLRLLLPSE